MLITLCSRTTFAIQHTYFRQWCLTWWSPTITSCSSHNYKVRYFHSSNSHSNWASLEVWSKLYCSKKVIRVISLQLNTRVLSLSIDASMSLTIWTWWSIKVVQSMDELFLVYEYPNTRGNKYSINSTRGPWPTSLTWKTSIYISWNWPSSFEKDF